MAEPFHFFFRFLFRFSRLSLTHFTLIWNCQLLCALLTLSHLSCMQRAVQLGLCASHTPPCRWLCSTLQAVQCATGKLQRYRAQRSLQQRTSNCQCSRNPRNPGGCVSPHPYKPNVPQPTYWEAYSANGMTQIQFGSPRLLSTNGGAQQNVRK